MSNPRGVKQSQCHLMFNVKIIIGLVTSSTWITFSVRDTVGCVIHELLQTAGELNAQVMSVVRSVSFLSFKSLIFV